MDRFTAQKREFTTYLLTWRTLPNAPEEFRTLYYALVRQYGFRRALEHSFCYSSMFVISFSIFAYKTRIKIS
jgi:hypothetical protein